MNCRDDTDSLEEGEIHEPEAKHGLSTGSANTANKLANAREVRAAVSAGGQGQSKKLKPASRSLKNKRPASSRPSRPVRRGRHARRSRSRSRSSSPPSKKDTKSIHHTEEQIRRVQDALTSITKLECRYQHLDSATQGFVNAVSSFRQLIDTGFVGQFKQQQQQQQLITLIGSLIVKSLRKIKSIHDSGSGRATIGQVQNWSHTSLLIKQVLSPIQPKLSITVDEKLEIDKLLNGSYMSMSAQARNPQTVEARSGSRNGILPKLPLPTKSTEPQQRNSTSPLFIKTKTAAPLSTLSSVTNGNNDHACSQQVKSRPDFDHPAVSEFTKTPNQLLSQGKLCLVLDLDHTLLQSVMYSELMPSTLAWLEKRLQATVNLPLEKRDLFKLESIQMFTKLRPGVREFLHQAAKLFELWIHTNGNATYAQAVVCLLDPNDMYFTGRIIAQGSERGESTASRLPKALNYGLQGRDAISIILDDTQAVWRAHEENLVTIDRYIYFPTVRSSSSNQSSAKSLLEQNMDEHPQQGLLTRMSTILSRVHNSVFEKNLKNEVFDVRKALQLERRKVLEGVHLVFSRVIPLGQDPTTHELWKLAESFGARCSTTLVPGVTHLVAGDAATEKAEAARAAGIAIVDPSWLRFCCAFWKKPDESKFPVATSARPLS